MMKALAALNVRDHIPLEQGLRHKNASVEEWDRKVRDHIPLEQGLRQDNGSHHRSQLCVRDHIPLEQGLRLGDGAEKFRLVWSETIFH